MDDDEAQEPETYPENEPQTGTNRYDLLRIALMPLAGLAQGIALAIDQTLGQLSLQSQVHDDKKAAEQMTETFK